MRRPGAAARFRSSRRPRPPSPCARTSSQASAASTSDSSRRGTKTWTSAIGSAGKGRFCTCPRRASGTAAASPPAVSDTTGSFRSSTRTRSDTARRGTAPPARLAYRALLAAGMALRLLLLPFRGRCSPAETGGGARVPARLRARLRGPMSAPRARARRLDHRRLQGRRCRPARLGGLCPRAGGRCLRDPGRRQRVGGRVARSGPRTVAEGARSGAAREHRLCRGDERGDRGFDRPVCARAQSGLPARAGLRVDR